MKTLNDKDNAPSLAMWVIAFVLFAVIFASFCYDDTKSIIRYELGFAESMLKGEFKDLYGAAYDTALYARENNLGGGAFPAYSLPLNLLLGIWGIPLYLYRDFCGIHEDITQSFAQVLYGKSILFIALIITVILVYKICCTLGAKDSESKWGAYFYFTALIVTCSIGTIGQCDVIGMILILSGFLAYIRGEYKKFLLYFIIAMPFKMYVFFLMFPLMLLREKNIMRIIRNLIFIAVPTLLCDLSLINNPAALRTKSLFNIAMLDKLTSLRLPLFHGRASVFVVLFGLLCVYCYLHDKHCENENKNFSLFISIVSGVILFISFPSYPYWIVYLVPYFAVACVCCSDKVNIILFETTGFASLAFSNYLSYFWCYDIHNNVNMFMYIVFGNPEFREGALTLTRLARSKLLHGTMRIFDAVFIVCMFTLVYLCSPARDNNTNSINYKQCAMTRLFINTLIAYIPVILFFNAIG